MHLQISDRMQDFEPGNCRHRDRSLRTVIVRFVFLALWRAGLIASHLLARKIFGLEGLQPMERSDFITVVSGLPRSGTSMMMSMLEAGGIAPISDGIRTADDDNPKGYYEFERVKKIKEDTGWIPDARGKAVKMISKLVVELPEGSHYRVIFMRRRMEEILASQQRMMQRRGTVRDDGPSDEVMAQFFEKHVTETLDRLNRGPQFDVIEIDYNAVLGGGGDEAITRIDEFLGGGLDTTAMRAVVDRNLYRQRA